MQGVGIKTDHMLLAGGGSVDPRWQQMLADFLGVPLVPAHDLGNATLGAAYLGGIAARHWRGVGDIPFPRATGTPVTPRPQAGLDDLLARFRATYRVLKDVPDARRVRRA
jgi:xylulokinase